MEDAGLPLKAKLKCRCETAVTLGDRAISGSKPDHGDVHSTSASSSSLQRNERPICKCARSRRSFLVSLELETSLASRGPVGTLRWRIRNRILVSQSTAGQECHFHETPRSMCSIALMMRRRLINVGFQELRESLRSIHDDRSYVLNSST